MPIRRWCLRFGISVIIYPSLTLLNCLKVIIIEPDYIRFNKTTMQVMRKTGNTIKQVLATMV